MKNTLPAKRFSLSMRLAIVFCFLCCILAFFSPSALFAGSIKGWGYNGYGQCNVPEPNIGFVAIAAGDGHSLGLKSDGSIIAWGSNSAGQCNVPEPNIGFVAIAAGSGHSLGLKSDGSIVGWGDNSHGQATPPVGNNFIAVAAGRVHSLALKSDGSIVGWGYNSYGMATPPVGNNFIAITAGNWHSLALKSDGSIVGWGYGCYGEATPPAGNNFIAIATCHNHSLGLKSDGSIIAWGLNNCGQATPPAGNDFLAIAAGLWHSLALKSDGSIVGWGDNYYGQATPPAGNDFIAIAAGGHSLALRRSPFSDLNGDAFVDFLDYSIFAKNWQQTPDPCDPNNGDIILDGYVDIYDLAELVEQWLTYLVSPATIPRPANHAAYTEKHLVLRWSSGENSTSHDIYFGTDFNEVNNADITNSAVYMGNLYSNNLWDTSNFDSNGLDFNTTYYWRIDEIAPGYQTKGDVWDFTTALGKVKNPQPSNGQQNVTPYTILGWSAADYAISHDIYFGTDFNEVNDADITSSGVYMGSQDVNFWNTNNYAPAGLYLNTTYYWRIDEVTPASITKGDVWIFTTVPPPPGQASNPNPANGLTDVNITTDLSWTAGSFATSHDVYFGTTNPPQFRVNQTGTIYDTATMDTNTTYYWQINEKNAAGTTTGDIWSLTTIAQLPGQAGNPIPANGAVAVDIVMNLSWTAGSLATSHDVYFGTTNPPLFRANQTGTTYDTVIMDTNTTYYWQIDEKNASGTTTGILWNFTTGAVLDPNLVAWWQFDEGTGTIAYDSAGNNYNGTITGATWYQDVSRGWCLNFDSSVDYVTVPDTTALDMSSAITITAWIKPANFADYYFIVTKQPSGTAGSNYPGNYEFRTEASTGRLNFLYQTSTGATYSSYTSSLGLTAGIWQHVVVTLGSGQVNFYIDGSLSGSTAQSGTFGILNNEPVRIGKRKDSSSYFNGSIDDVRIYNMALSADEVAILYAQ